MQITRDYPAEQLARSTKAYRMSVWKRLGLAVVLGCMLGYLAVELIKGFTGT